MTLKYFYRFLFSIKCNIASNSRVGCDSSVKYCNMGKKNYIKNVISRKMSLNTFCLLLDNCAQNFSACHSCAGFGNSNYSAKDFFSSVLFIMSCEIRSGKFKSWVKLNGQKHDFVECSSFFLFFFFVWILGISIDVKQQNNEMWNVKCVFFLPSLTFIQERNFLNIHKGEIKVCCRDFISQKKMTKLRFMINVDNMELVWL